MKFYSTADKNYRVTFEEAVVQGLAPNGGLFLPEEIDRLPDSFWKEISSKTFRQLSFDVAAHFLKDSLPEAALKKIIDHTVSFDAPLVEVEKNIFALELYHGPTMAFKDFGARFLSGVLEYCSRQSSREITILVATSGDTGSAVANGFYKVPGTKVIVLYPSGKVSDIQEKQFTTLGHNITALEVEGTFDDCQRLVKQAFSDPIMSSKLSLTSANSINIARLLPQMFYYFNAYAQLKDKSKPVVFSVPSGNFGNLSAGLMAKRMGLPVRQFIAATNINDVVPEYLINGKFSPRPSQQTISNAMDVGNPSNFARMMDLYQNDFKKISNDIAAFHYTDDQTRDGMLQTYRSRNYAMDPHGAIGYLALKDYIKGSDMINGIFLETAHPGKFKDVVEDALGISLPLPEGLLKFVNGKKTSVRMSNEYQEFRQFLMSLPVT